MGQRMRAEVEPRPNAATIGAVSAACALAAVLVAVWLLYRHRSARRRAIKYGPVGMPRPRPGRLPSGGFTLQEEDVTYELDKEGQPRILGEGTFGQVKPMAGIL